MIKNIMKFKQETLTSFKTILKIDRYSGIISKGTVEKIVDGRLVVKFEDNSTKFLYPSMFQDIDNEVQADNRYMYLLSGRYSCTLMKDVMYYDEEIIRVGDRDITKDCDYPFYTEQLFSNKLEEFDFVIMRRKSDAFSHNVYSIMEISREQITLRLNNYALEDLPVKHDDLFITFDKILDDNLEIQFDYFERENSKKPRLIIEEIDGRVEWHYIP